MYRFTFRLLATLHEKKTAIESQLPPSWTSSYPTEVPLCAMMDETSSTGHFVSAVGYPYWAEIAVLKLRRANADEKVRILDLCVRRSCSYRALSIGSLTSSYVAKHIRMTLFIYTLEKRRPVANLRNYRPDSFLTPSFPADKYQFFNLSLRFKLRLGSNSDHHGRLCQAVACRAMAARGEFSTNRALASVAGDGSLAKGYCTHALPPMMGTGVPAGKFTG